MAEYLHPGVYVQETSYRAKSIEGVSTSTTGFVGQAAYGPTVGLPLLVTSFEEFRRAFGGLEDLQLGGVPTSNWMGHAVRAYFDNGGKRLYVARVYNPDAGLTAAAAAADVAADAARVAANADPADLALADAADVAEAAAVVAAEAASGRAFADTAAAAGAVLRARYPGQGGNLDVTFALRLGTNALSGVGGTPAVRGLRTGDLVNTNPADDTEISGSAVRADDGTISLVGPDGSTAIGLGGLTVVRKASIVVTVNGSGREDSYPDLSTHPGSTRFIGNVLRDHDPYEASARIWIDLGIIAGGDATVLASELLTWGAVPLDGGLDGDEMTDVEIRGAGEGNSSTGLLSLAEIEDISIVACPGGAALTGPDQPQLVRDELITHCELLQYRFAVVSAPDGLDTNGIRAARAVHDSSHAALYYPWAVIRDPNGEPGDVLSLPPDGYVCGIYARSDVERGVHKAPANETVRGILRFAENINERVQDVLNPEGINCLRSFEGRGRRVWGARTLSSDPEWKYVNVRRLFIYLEHSIDRATQWVVFEPNNSELWLKVQLTIESFLTDTWRTGALMGASEKEAFFVRCDRTTMTQGDLDNGRLICLIGVAPTYPAEFVIFRIGQWTAEASIV